MWGLMNFLFCVFKKSLIIRLIIVYLSPGTGAMQDVGHFLLDVKSWRV